MNNATYLSKNRNYMLFWAVLIWSISYFLFQFFFRFTIFVGIGLFIYVLLCSIHMNIDIIDVSVLRKFVPVVVFFGWMTISSLYSLDPRDSLLAVVKLLPFFFFMILLSQFSYAYFKMCITKLSVFIPIFSCIIFVTIYFTMGSLIPIYGQISYFLQPAFRLHITKFCLVLLPFSFYGLFLCESIKLRYIVSIISTTIICYLSVSRIAIFIVGFSCFSTLFLCRSRKVAYFRILLLFIFLVLIIAGLFAIFLRTSPVTEGLITRYSSLKLKSTVSSLLKENQQDYIRILTFIEGYRFITTKPLFGYGYNSMKYHIDEMTGTPMVSHNLIITFWGEMGLIGLMVFLWMFGKPLFRTMTVRKASKLVNKKNYYWFSSIIASFVNLMMIGIVQNVVINISFYLVLALLYSTIMHTSEIDQEE